MLKKYLVKGLCTLLTLALCLPCIQMTAVFADSMVYYENTFDNGAASAVNYSDENGTMTYAGIRCDSAFNGNAGSGSRDTAVSDKHKYVFNSPVSSGILSISFDFSGLGRQNYAAGAGTGVMINDVGTANLYAFMVNGDESFGGKIFGPKDNLAPWGESNCFITRDANALYKYRQLFDLDNNKVYTYINNSLHSVKALAADLQINDIAVSTSLYTSYFDNFKIAKVNSVSFTDGVYYSNEYYNGVLSAVDYSDANGTMDYKAGIIDGVYNGNKGIGSSTGAWGETHTYTLNNAVSSGVISISFDFCDLGRNNVMDGPYSGIYYNADNSGKFGLTMKRDNSVIGIFGRTDNLAANDTTSVVPFESEALYKVRQLLDLDNDKIYTYINNELLSVRKLPVNYSLESAGFVTSMHTAYFDNLRIAAESSLSFKDGVYYKNGFCGGKASAVGYADQKGLMNFTTGTAIVDAEYNGNKGFGGGEGMWGNKQTYTLNNAASNGVISVSFDFCNGNRNLDGIKGPISYILYNKDTVSTDECIGLTIIRKPGETGKIYNCKDNFAGGDLSTVTEYDGTSLYNIRQKLDLDNDKIYTYINNSLKSVRNLPENYTLTTIKLQTSTLTAYIDNLCIKDETSLFAGAEEVKAVVRNDSAAVISPVMVVCYYNGDALDGVKMYNDTDGIIYPDETGSFACAVTDAGGRRVKAFLFNNMTSLTPLANFAELSVR